MLPLDLQYIIIHLPLSSTVSDLLVAAAVLRICFFCCVVIICLHIPCLVNYTLIRLNYKAAADNLFVTFTYLHLVTTHSSYLELNTYNYSYEQNNRTKTKLAEALS